MTIGPQVRKGCGRVTAGSLSYFQRFTPATDRQALHEVQSLGGGVIKRVVVGAVALHRDVRKEALHGPVATFI